MPSMRRSSVTLSTLLNVIDGVGSEEGKLFFATVIKFLIRLSEAKMKTIIDKLHRSIGPGSTSSWTH